MGALAVNQLLETAQNKGLELAIETAHLENQLLLEEVDKMSLDALPKNPKRGVALVILIFIVLLNIVYINVCFYIV
jgi:hypothetical protein